MYIHAYIAQYGTLYTQVKSWSGNELNGNEPLIFSINDNIEGYENITNIKNWYKFCTNKNKLRPQLEYCYFDTTWEELDLDEKKIIASYFIVDKTLRDEVLTEEEQNNYNYYLLYDFISDDVYEYKNLNNNKITPKSIDYKKELDIRLHPKYTFDSQGYLTQCIYYQNLELTQNQLGFTVYTYSNPIIHYSAVYNIKPDGYVGSRVVTRKWYMADGTLSNNAKISEKFYEPMKARDEGKRRRQNLINNLIIDTVGLFIMTSPDLNNVTDAETDAMEFMKEVGSGISEYYEYGNKMDIDNNPCKLIQQVMNSTYSRLNNFVPGTNNTVTIRMFLISRLNI